MLALHTSTATDSRDADKISTGRQVTIGQGWECRFEEVRSSSQWRYSWTGADANVPPRAEAMATAAEATKPSESAFANYFLPVPPAAVGRDACVRDAGKVVGVRPGFPSVTPIEIPVEQCKVWQLAPRGSPPIGCKNTQGRRPRMEDTDRVVPHFVEMPVLCKTGDRVVPKAMEDGLAPLFQEEAPGSPRTPLARFPSEQSEDGMRTARMKPVAPEKERRVDSSFHFAGVYDGHGGQLVSNKVAERLHVLVEEALMQIMVLSSAVVRCATSEFTIDSCASETFHRSSTLSVGTTSLKRKHSRRGSNDIAGCHTPDSVPSPTHKTARTTGDGEFSSGSPAGAGNSPASLAQTVMSRLLMNHPGVKLEEISVALRLAFQRMDDELWESQQAKNVGSTAVVSMVSGSHICLANCGDSRAVLSRGGMAYRLTRDHKPEMEDEQDRIQNCGGKVLDFNGKRVMGLLAMSRAIGDHCLRNVGVVAEPEVTIIPRSPEDEFLVLASDGLWDALSDSEVCDLGQRCFRRARERGAVPETAARVAASVLMRAALDRGSSDNITVVVVDLH